jgi:hypothetical protein
MKKKLYTVPKSKGKIIETGKIGTSLNMHQSKNTFY